jgi:hypothetical protein
MLRIIAITAVVCAATGMTTQAEAAERKIAPGSIQLQGCAYWMPLCGTVMGSAPDIYVLSPSVPWNTPITVFGRRTPRESESDNDRCLRECLYGPIGRSRVPMALMRRE